MFRSIILLCLLTFVAASLPDDATTWTVVQVNEWVDTLGVSSASTIKAGVTKHGITGNILMVLDDTDLQEELGVSSGVERKKLFLQINLLKDSESEKNAKLTFWELRALNRQMVDYATPLLTVAPRWAITTFDDFPEYCRPAAALGEGHNSIMGWVEWALFPECVVAVVVLLLLCCSCAEFVKIFLSLSCCISMERLTLLFFYFFFSFFSLQMVYLD